MPVFKQGDDVIYQENYLKPQYKARVMKTFNVLGYFEYIVRLSTNGLELRCSSLNLEVDDGRFDLENDHDLDLFCDSIGQPGESQRFPTVSEVSDDSIGQPCESQRFPTVSEEEANNLIASRLSKGTVKQTHYAVKILKDWLAERKMDIDFEKMTKEDLAEMLKKFYADIRDKKGETYNHNTLRGIRGGLQRHLSTPPHNNLYNIITDPVFNQANQIFEGYIKVNKKMGKDKTKHKDIIIEEDWIKLHQHPLVADFNPTSLQNKVFLNIMTHFGRRGREGLRNLKKDSFSLKVHPNGKEYFEMAFNELTKNHQTSDTRDKTQLGDQIMWCQDDNQCPVKSLKIYLTKLHPNSDYLFTYPKKAVNEQDVTWYTTRPIGENTLGEKVKKLSIETGLSRVYTNHCLRATVTTKLSEAGIPAHKIIKVTGHKNINSINHYVHTASIKEKAEMSSILHGHANQDKPAALGAPPVPLHTDLAIPEATMTTPQTPSTTSQATLATPPPQEASGFGSAMFWGSVMNHPTININYNVQSNNN